MPFDTPTDTDLDIIRRAIGEIQDRAITAVVIPSDEHYPDHYRLGTYSYRLEWIKAGLPAILAAVERLEARLAEDAGTIGARPVEVA